MNRWIRIALKIAKTGIHPGHLLGAVVVKGGTVISKAANMSRPYGVDNCGFHAEERALRNLSNCKGATIIVARVNSKKQIAGLSRPCERCMRVIRLKGIKKIIYIDNYMSVQTERVTNVD